MKERLVAALKLLAVFVFIWLLAKDLASAILFYGFLAVMVFIRGSLWSIGGHPPGGTIKKLYHTGKCDPNCGACPGS